MQSIQQSEVLHLQYLHDKSKKKSNNNNNIKIEMTSGFKPFTNLSHKNIYIYIYINNNKNIEYIHIYSCVWFLRFPT